MASNNFCLDKSSDINLANEANFAPGWTLSVEKVIPVEIISPTQKIIRLFTFIYQFQTWDLAYPTKFGAEIPISSHF